MNDIKYRKVGDFYFPNIKVATEEIHQLGKYGRMKLAYMKEHKKFEYQMLSLKGELVKYLHSIDEDADNMYEALLSQYKEKWGITEEMKELDQMRWVQEMNNIEKCIKEVILSTIIY